MKLVCHSRTKSRKRELAVLFSTHRAIYPLLTVFSSIHCSATFYSACFLQVSACGLFCWLCSPLLIVLSWNHCAQCARICSLKTLFCSARPSTRCTLFNYSCSFELTVLFCYHYWYILIYTVFYSLVSQDSSALQRRRSRWLDQIWAASSTIGVRRLLAPRLLEHTLEVTRHETLPRHTWGHFCFLNTSISRVILCFCPNLYNDKAD